MLNKTFFRVITLFLSPLEDMSPICQICLICIPVYSFIKQYPQIMFRKNYVNLIHSFRKKPCTHKWLHISVVVFLGATETFWILLWYLAVADYLNRCYICGSAPKEQAWEKGSSKYAGHPRWSVLSGNWTSPSAELIEKLLWKMLRAYLRPVFWIYISKSNAGKVWGFWCSMWNKTTFLSNK